MVVRQGIAGVFVRAFHLHPAFRSQLATAVEAKWLATGSGRGSVDLQLAAGALAESEPGRSRAPRDGLRLRDHGDGGDGDPGGVFQSLGWRRRYSVFDLR